MGKTQRLITIGLWGLLGLAVVAVIGMKVAGFGRPNPPALAPTATGLPNLYPAADFAMTDQDGKAFGSKDLRGRPWVGAFVFTTCGDTCPRITQNMAGLQAKLPADMHLVSFTVNPEYDTPAVLKAYARTWKADESRWHFLTGSRDQMFDAAAGMKLAARPADGESPILHSEKVVLVDADGNVRGYYNGIKAEELAKLEADVAALAKEPRARG